MNPKKRRFSDCEELKATLGSQFRQYLCKTILASELNTMRRKLAIHESVHGPRNICASCRTPTTVKPEDRHACGQRVQCPRCSGVLACTWDFCPRDKTHDCHICGQSACSKSWLTDLFCSMCRKPMCRKCENGCYGCRGLTCKACAPAEEFAGVVVASPLLHSLGGTYCVAHRQERIRYSRALVECETCCDDWRALDVVQLICEVRGCGALVCVHGPNFDEDAPKCPEHQ